MRYLGFLFRIGGYYVLLWISLTRNVYSVSSALIIRHVNSRLGPDSEGSLVPCEISILDG
jgi:hypothetical protein